MTTEPIRQITSVAVPLMRDNVDTDQIIPSREMRTVSRVGLADGLFAGWRYVDAESRAPDGDFILNAPAYKDACILLAGANFGCGSSREHAVWALKEYGFRAIIAESFGEIFYNNCIRNGLLPVSLPRGEIARIAEAMPAPVRIDLVGQLVSGLVAETLSFRIEPFARRMLLEGRDPIDLTLESAAEITAWLEHDRGRRPWLYESLSKGSRQS
jgi:3-isopropylmalate/(R)-2-methylmalate dehydratase small subunit